MKSPGLLVSQAALCLARIGYASFFPAGVMLEPGSKSRNTAPVFTTGGMGDMKVLICIVLALALAGCNTVPVSNKNATPAPVDRLLAFQTPLSEPSGTIVVTRDKGFNGSGCYYALFINGTLAARLAPSETATFYVPPGDLLLRSARDPEGRGLCNTFKSEWTERETSLRGGEKKYFRLSIDMNGKTDIQRTDQ